MRRARAATGSCRALRDRSAAARDAIARGARRLPPRAPRARASRRRRPAHRFHRIDVHTHIAPDGVERAVRLMNEWGIDGMVNLSGMYPGPPHNALERQLAAAAESGGRIAVFTTPDFRLVRAASPTTARRWPTS